MREVGIDLSHTHIQAVTADNLPVEHLSAFLLYFLVWQWRGEHLPNFQFPSPMLPGTTRLVGAGSDLATCGQSEWWHLKD